MPYAVKEIYHTLQGEGAQAGRPAVFLRFAGCNLWSGRENDRADAICKFCDTEFVGIDGPGGGRFESAEELAKAAAGRWPEVADFEKDSPTQPLVVCTGGEPLLQLDEPAVAALQSVGFEVALETNGTLPLPCEVDWCCVSPKANSECVVTSGDELKLVFPQKGAEPNRYESLKFTRFFLQPMDGNSRDENTALCVEYCLQNPQWELSVQMHKLVGLR